MDNDMEICDGGAASRKTTGYGTLDLKQQKLVSLRPSQSTIQSVMIYLSSEGDKINYSTWLSITTRGTIQLYSVV